MSTDGYSFTDRRCTLSVLTVKYAALDHLCVAIRFGHFVSMMTVVLQRHKVQIVNSRTCDM
jgi:hypothetical protein